MKKRNWKITFLLVTAIALLFVGCGKDQGEMNTEEPGGTQAIEQPKLLDFTVEKKASTEVIGDTLVTTEYPALTLGSPHWNGEYQNGAEQDALKAVLSDYREEIREEQKLYMEDSLRPAAEQQVGPDALDLYSLVDAFVTRNDNQVVSFYENTSRYLGLDEIPQRRKTFNLDAKTGKKLTFVDVFMDLDQLAEILAKEFSEELQGSQVAELKEKVFHAMSSESENLCFSLGYGGVHIFAEKEPLNGEMGSLNEMLSYNDHPELVKPEYRASPESWMLKLERGREYVLPDGTVLQMYWDYTDIEIQEVEWNVQVNGVGYRERFYGHGTECVLMHTPDGNYLWLQVPGGGVSQLTNVYTIMQEGLVKVAQVEAALCEEMNMNPERLMMNTNDLITSGAATLQPRGIYRLLKDGFPELISNEEFGLSGSAQRLRKGVEVTLADPYDIHKEDGLLNLEAGTLLTPYRTDKVSYLDFADEEGNICRFAIDGFTEEMNMSGYGTLGELFEA